MTSVKTSEHMSCYVYGKVEGMFQTTQGSTEIPGMSENPDLPGADIHRWDQILDKIILNSYSHCF